MQHRASEEDGRFTALTAKVGPKGQIVIPKDIRDTFGIEPGDTVLVLSDSEQVGRSRWERPRARWSSQRGSGSFFFCRMGITYISSYTYAILSVQQV